MTQEERSIYNFLKTTPDIFYSVREIARRAGKRDMRHESPTWVTEFLQRLVRKGIVETDSAGHYRLKPKPPLEADGRRWVSPHMARLLKESNTDYSKAAVTEISTEDLDGLEL